MLKKKTQTCHSASCKHTICSCSATATAPKASERLEERSSSLQVILSSCVLIAREVPWFLPRLSYWQKLANSAQAICTAAWTDSSQWKETEATPRLSRGPDVPAERINCSASPALKKSSIIYFNQEFHFPAFHWLLESDAGNSITQIVIQEHEHSNLQEKNRSLNKLKAGCSPWTSHSPSTLQVSSGDRMEGTAMFGTTRLTLHILENPQDG